MDTKEVEFKAELITVRFSSEDYKICVVDVDEEYKLKRNVRNEVVIVGNMPNLIPNQEYIIKAIPEINKTYGTQYKITSIRQDKPTSLESSRTFLANLLTERQADILLEAYPDIIDRIIKGEEIDLNKTKGIKEATFSKIKDKVVENFVLLDLVDLFNGAISLNVIRKLFLKYHSVEVILKKLRKEPYRCLCELSRVGFKTADAILLTVSKNLTDVSKFAFDEDLITSKQRLKACIDYILEDNELKGNTVITMKEVRKLCGELTPECINHFVSIVKEYSTKGDKNSDNHKKTIFIDMNRKLMGKRETIESEIFILKTLLNMKKNSVEWNINPDLYRFDGDFELTDEQMNTLYNAVKYNISILTAPAGSGKTASINNLLNMLDDNGKTYLLGTPTGKSSEVLQRQTGREASTIHRMLDFNPSNDPSWTYNANNKLEVDYVIIDEFGMVDVNLMTHLLEAIDTTNTKLLLVFDSYQLASVGAGNLAHDLLNSGIIPTTILTKIFRFDEGGLMQVVTKVRNGEKFLDNDFKGVKIFGEKKDFAYVETLQTNIPKQVLKIYNKILNDGYSVDDVMILSSMNKGDYGTKKLNALIQRYLQRDKDNNFLMRGTDKFFKDDRVIQVTNNYRAMDVHGKTTPVYNGNVGTIVEVNYGSMIVDFGNDKLITYNKNELNQLELGYCLSIHKCLTPNMSLLTNKGIIKFKNYDSEGENMIFNGKNMEKPSNYIELEDEECLKITTEKGYFIEGTLDHRIYVLDEKGKLTYKTLSELQKGEQIFLHKNSQVFNEEEIILNTNYEIPSKGKGYILPKTLTPELSEFLGMIIADGTTRKSGIQYSKRYKEVSDRFKYLAEYLFGYVCNEPKKRKSGDYIVYLNSTQIMNFLSQFNGLTPNNKAIPEQILQSSKECQCSFLKGLFEDGTVNLKEEKFDHIEFSQSFKNIIDDVQLMLLNMGIISSKVTRTKKSKGKILKQYTLYIYISQVQEFVNNIGFISNKKQHDLIEGIKNYGEFNNNRSDSYVGLYDIVYGLYCDYKDVFKKHYKKIGKRYDLTNIINYHKDIKKISIKKLGELLDVLKDIDDKRILYLKYIYQNLYPVKITNIENTGKQKVCCVTMSKTSTFVQNGFLGMNCQGDAAKQVIVVAPKAHNYMLNSNLLYVAGTRARERVFMIGNIITVNRAINKKENLSRNTYISYLTNKE